jgi:uncharacterized repeat protein (TIGR03833 family)
MELPPVRRKDPSPGKRAPIAAIMTMKRFGEDLKITRSCNKDIWPRCHHYFDTMDQGKPSPDKKAPTGSGKNRKDIHPGLTVDIVLKKDQRTGKRTRGVVKDILTNSSYHPRGIKVRLSDGQIGRVQQIIG